MSRWHYERCNCMDAEKSRNTQVVIVGAGPTGLAAANLLGLYGIQTILLERCPDLSTFPRAVAIDDEGLRICQALGLQEEILRHVRLDLAVEYRSGKQSLALVTPRNRPNGYPLVSTFYQPALERILLHGLARFPCVQVCFGHTLTAFAQTSARVTLQVHMANGERCSLTCAYLLACDGGKSAIRHALNIAMRPITPFPFFPQNAAMSTQRWLVVDGADTDTAERQRIIFFCNPARPAVTIPTPDQTRRWEFMLFPGEHEEEMLRADTFHRLVRQTRFMHNSTDDKPTILRQAIYTFHALLASSFSRGRVFLLGDAAHLMPPFGGQGLNSGLRDAYNLCWKLAYVLQTHTSNELLASYEQERAPHVARMIRFSSQLGQMIMPTQRSIALARDLILRSLTRIPPIKESLNEMRVKPVASYQSGWKRLLTINSAQEVLGILLPQAQVVTEDGETILLDALLGHSFSLLRLSEKAGALVGEILHLAIAPEPQAASFQQATARITIIDRQRTLSRIARRARGGWLLLRPDHFVLDILFYKRKQAAEL
ncbi:MAG TPA: bifunctional 3-(3-hydroxy-phenyl)propionate/3-hydroxycinnamic acid hydroxylase [Ktedonobacteraceae bacterium]|nr:bifunctional 3-(3-hydroxy-phenyl)propionate/3-hydroxycinnamic acid hydroxylase [Ktedonobacteraceae bacterium]